LLRLVEDDTAALRGFQTASDKISFPNCGKSFAARVEGSQPQTSAAGRSASQFSGPEFFPIFRLIFLRFFARNPVWCIGGQKQPAGSAKELMITRNERKL
jgi:hypothetical protein